MGCDANAVWGEFAAKINSKQGAEKDLQIITGTPTIDDIPAKKKLGKIGFKDISLHEFSMPIYPLGLWSFIQCKKAL